MLIATRLETAMRPSFRALLCLPPLALAAAALYLLARAGLAGPDPEPLAEPWPLTALDPSVEERVRCATRRAEAKRQVACGLIDGRLTFQQAAAQFQDIDAGVRDAARRWRPPEYTAEELPYRQVISFVHAEGIVSPRRPKGSEQT
jgi:hypothetical protein